MYDFHRFIIFFCSLSDVIISFLLFLFKNSFFLRCYSVTSRGASNRSYINPPHHTFIPTVHLINTNYIVKMNESHAFMLPLNEGFERIEEISMYSVNRSIFMVNMVFAVIALLNGQVN